MSHVEWIDGEVYYKGSPTCCTKLARKSLELTPIDVVQLNMEGKTKVFRECVFCKETSFEFIIRSGKLLYFGECAKCRAFILFYLKTPLGTILGTGT